MRTRFFLEFAARSRGVYAPLHVHRDNHWRDYRLYSDFVLFQGRHGSEGWQESSLKKTAERLSKSREQQASLQGAEDALFLQTR